MRDAQRSHGSWLRLPLCVRTLDTRRQRIGTRQCQLPAAPCPCAGGPASKHVQSPTVVAARCLLAASRRAERVLQRAQTSVRGHRRASPPAAHEGRRGQEAARTRQRRCQTHRAPGAHAPGRTRRSGTGPFAAACASRRCPAPATHRGSPPAATARTPSSPPPASVGRARHRGARGAAHPRGSCGSSGVETRLFGTLLPT